MGKLKTFRIRNTRLQHIPSTARELGQDPPYWLGRALRQDIGWFLYGLYAQVREKIIHGLDPWAPMGWAYGAVFWQDYGRTAHVKWWTHRNLLLLVYFPVYLAFNKIDWWIATFLSLYTTLQSTLSKWAIMPIIVIGVIMSCREEIDTIGSPPTLWHHWYGVEHVNSRHFKASLLSEFTTLPATLSLATK